MGGSPRLSIDQLAARRRLWRHRGRFAALHVEGHARGLAKDLLQLGRVRKARHLHQDALAAFGLDGRLRSAERIQAAVEDLHALRHRRAHACFDAGVRQVGSDAPACFSESSTSLSVALAEECPTAIGAASGCSAVSAF